MKNFFKVLLYGYKRSYLLILITGLVYPLILFIINGETGLNFEYNSIFPYLLFLLVAPIFIYICPILMGFIDISYFLLTVIWSISLSVFAFSIPKNRDLNKIEKRTILTFYLFWQLFSLHSFFKITQFSI